MWVVDYAMMQFWGFVIYIVNEGLTFFGWTIFGTLRSFLIGLAADFTTFAFGDFAPGLLTGPRDA